MAQVYKDIIRLTIDLKTGVKEVIAPIKQADNLSRVLRCQLVNNGKPVSLKGSQLLLYVIKTDFKQCVINGVINESKAGIVDFELTEQSLILAEEIQCEIVKIDEGDVLLSFPIFKIGIDGALYDNGLVESTNEFSALTALISNVASWENRFVGECERIEEKFDEKISEVNTQLSDTLASLDRICIDFVSYGGVADEITDNTTLLQQLINELHYNGGGNIYFPPGTFFFASEVTWRSNVSLFGAGKGVTILKTGGHTVNGYSLFRATRSNPIKNCCFRDFTQDAYNQTIDYYSHTGKSFYFQDCENCTWENLELKGTPATALGVDSLTNCHISKITTIDCGRLWQEKWTGVDGTGSGSSKGPGGAGIGIGTGYRETEHFTISDCICINSGHFGIFIEHQAIFEPSKNIYKSRGITISNCIAINGQYGGIGVRAGKDITIVGCVSYGNAHGIYLDAGNIVNASKDVLKLENIIISNCSFNENTKYGIVVNGTCELNNLIIDGCVIENNQAHGILICANGSSTTEYTQEQIKVSNCIIRKNQCGIGIGDHTRVSNVDITNCNITENREEGIRDANNYIVSTVINDNKIQSNIGKGISLVGKKKNYTVANNSIIGNGSYGFDTVGGVDDCQIINNRCFNNVGIGIRISGSNKFLNIKQNVCSDFQEVQTQQYGIYMLGNFIKSSVMYNDCRFNSTSSIDKNTQDTESVTEYNII